VTSSLEPRLVRFRKSVNNFSKRRPLRNLQGLRVTGAPSTRGSEAVNARIGLTAECGC
jgi:hypothetical protein